MTSPTPPLAVDEAVLAELERTAATTCEILLSAAREARELRERVKVLAGCLRPFVQSYLRDECPVSDSDLYDEQPRSVHVTLGDCRRARAALGGTDDAPTLHEAGERARERALEEAAEAIADLLYSSSVTTRGETIEEAVSAIRALKGRR